MTGLATTGTIPTRANAIAIAIASALSVFLFLGLPLLLDDGPGPLALLAVLPVLAIVPHWALIHEAVHGHLLPGRRANELAGHLLAILFLAPFPALRFGHLSHHALNARATERPELYDPATTPRLRAALAYYPRLLGGLYLFEVLSGPLSLLPRRVLRPLVRRVFYEGAQEAMGMAERAERRLLEPGTLRAIRLDALLVLLLLLVSVQLYGANWPVLAAALLARAFLVSLMDNAPHYGGPLADPDQGYDMRASPLLSLLVLHTNLHGTHHRHPGLPWTALPAAFAAEGGRFDGHYLLRPWRQLRGPIPLDRLAPSRAEGQP
ncbi:MAG: fatty acid desaturase [Geminicoccaceae bacterium]|nr:fatty acid desaturase [Geminicoccaceae bacterium]MDW8370279.1 fatty acid desaturase [Geminicoccaceae bacterium]